MWIVAAHTIPGLLGVVGVNVLVARGAGCRRSRADVVRRVAARANVVRSDTSAADHVDLRVTVATGRGLLFLEFVRLVTADALLVPARK